jgi:hypothetical protein
MAGIRQLPAHQHHEREPEKEEDEPGNAVLDSDHLVVGRDDVLPPKGEFVVVVSVIVVMRIVFGMRLCGEARGCVHKRNLKLSIRAKFSIEKRLFEENTHPPVKIAPPGAFACVKLAGRALGPLWAHFSLIDYGFSSFL